MRPWHGPAFALLFSIVGSGCGGAAAQEQKVVFEHGVFEWVHYRSAAKGDQERYAWTTAAEEIQRDTAGAFFGALGIKADLAGNSADRVRVVDYLAAKGWQILDRTDVGYADAGGSAIAERYLLRRPR
jgi:hypothetical protein